MKPEASSRLDQDRVTEETGIVDGTSARAAIVAGDDGREALRRALAEVGGGEVDAAVLFAGAAYAADFPALVETVWRATGARVLIGCSGGGVIGPGREEEGTAALALLTLALPGATLRGARFTQELIERADPAVWHRGLGVAPEAVNAWLAFADPFGVDADGLVNGLARAYPGLPVVGGLASAGPLDRRTWLFLDGEVHEGGAVGLAIGGAFALLPVVSQGCAPIGVPWTITAAHDNWIATIGNRPAAQVLAETLEGLPEAERARAQRNLLLGLAADEYRHEFGRGDFLIRNLVGFDREGGALAVGALPRVGQTVQFQVRDAATAHLDLLTQLDAARTRLVDRAPVAAVLCSCNGRGERLFGVPHHDAAAIARKLGPLPVAGLFCNGEIGPVGRRPFLHGFTASLGLVVGT